MPIKSQKGLAKTDRVLKALHHAEADRVPIFEYYWTSFIRRWRQELGLAKDADPYKYYDIDIINISPNVYPWIRPFEILSQTEEETILRTGFGAVVRKVHAFPMPEYVCFDTDTIERCGRSSSMILGTSDDTSGAAMITSTRGR